MLEVIANALRSPSARRIEEYCLPYRNGKEEWGYSLTVWDAGHYHMISVSHVVEIPTLVAVAEAIESPTRYVKEDGRYRNARGTIGYWATVKSGDHWYMVSVSDMLQPFHNGGGLNA
jgi:hypothetical protein